MKILIAIACLLVGLAECYQNGDVRLYQDYSAGRLEVYRNGDWGSVCYDSGIDQRGMAQAVCRQLGQRNFMQVMRLADMPGYDENNTAPVLSKVSCSYNNNPDYGEEHILRCSNSDEEDAINCDVGDEVFISCEAENKDANPYNTMVRLEKLSVTEISTGILEVYVNNAWGTVCNLGDASADTACRQLGYTGHAIITTVANYTRNPIVLDGFTCETAETCLRNCFDYPAQDDEVMCDDGEVSVVTCTFDEENLSSPGSRSICQDDTGLSAGAIAGIAVGSVVGVIILLLLVVGALFCLLPKCRSSNKTKYDAI